jgi:RHS repeat-associated protein
VTDPLGQATTYTWNGQNQLLTQTDANGHTTGHGYSYDAFGVELGSDEGMPANDAAAHAVSHRYTGEYTDRHTGLIYLRARDYDPKVGRFIGMDEHPGSQRIPLTLNKYL